MSNFYSQEKEAVRVKLYKLFLQFVFVLPVYSSQAVNNWKVSMYMIAYNIVIHGASKNKARIYTTIINDDQLLIKHCDLRANRDEKFGQ